MTTIYTHFVNIILATITFLNRAVDWITTYHMAQEIWRNRVPDSKVYGANMGPTWVLSAPFGPHVGPMDIAIWGGMPGVQFGNLRGVYLIGYIRPCVCLGYWAFGKWKWLVSDWSGVSEQHYRLWICPYCYDPLCICLSNYLHHIFNMI